jgi:hypothetical protein
MWSTTAQTRPRPKNGAAMYKQTSGPIRAAHGIGTSSPRDLASDLKCPWVSRHDLSAFVRELCVGVRQHCPTRPGHLQAEERSDDPIDDGLGFGGGLDGDEGRLLQGRFHGVLPPKLQRCGALGGQLGVSTPNCFAYSAFNRCQPPNFIASPATMRPMGVPLEQAPTVVSFTVVPTVPQAPIGVGGRPFAQMRRVG